MKKIQVYLSILAIAAVTGCTKELEQANPNSQTTSTFWRNQDDAIMGINAAYSSLLPDGAYMRSTPLMLDTRGEDAKSNSPWGQMYNTGKFALQSGNWEIYGWAYETFYQGIYRCNQVLENVPGIAMDQGLKDRLIGQAYFLRGLYFYHLVNFFGRVPLILHTPQNSSEFLVPQSSNADGWAQVINDFEKAIALLPAKYSTVTGPDKDDIGRATKGAAMAFLGKAYLFNKKWTEAAEQFSALLGMGYDLMPNYKDNFTEAKENNIESLFEVQFSRSAGGVELGWGGVPQPGWGKTSARAITYAPRGFGWTDVQPTRFIFNEFLLEKTTTLQDDPRLVATIAYNKPGLTLYGQLFSVRYASNLADLNDLFCLKYENSDGSRPDEYDWRSGINERIMRFADVLLMYAECLNELNQTPAAYTHIQRVRNRVGLPALPAGLSQAAMREQLSHERLLEFCLEGHRFDDVRRWGWLQDPVKLALLKSRDPEFNTYAAGREYYPIPQREIDINTGYTQNDGY
jgi:tetratricopeptide (TPR) repeat protein